MKQLGLFGAGPSEPPRSATRRGEREVSPCVIDDDLRALAGRLPAWLRLGTSSWTFPGWGPHLVYGDVGLSPGSLADRGLAAYAQHPLFRTVGIDRTHYAPMPADAWARYRAQVGDDFVPVAKVWSGIASATDRSGGPNASFLDAERFLETMWEPAMAAGFDARMPFVFEVPPMAPAHRPPLAFFLERLEGLLAALPQEGRFTFELRTREWLVEPYVRLLERFGASHAINYWSFMPGPLRQWSCSRSAASRCLVVRLMLPPGATYEAQKSSFSPFDREVHPQPGMHDELNAILTEVSGIGAPPEVFVLANNKAEGSAPLTCRRVAERFVAHAEAP